MGGMVQQALECAMVRDCRLGLCVCGLDRRGWEWKWE